MRREELVTRRSDNGCDPPPRRPAMSNTGGTNDSRSNGTFELTYAGHPLYYSQGDNPGRVLCQNVSSFGGLWLVVRPNGGPVR
jgi:hypothetical protein